MQRLCFLLAAAALLSFAPSCARTSAHDRSMAMPDASAGGGAAPEAPMYAEAAARSDSYSEDEQLYSKEEAAPEEPGRAVLGAPPAPQSTTGSRPEKAGGSQDSGGVKLAPTTSPTTSEPAKEDPPKQFARQIIYVAEMAISVFKLDEAMKRVEALTLETGGYIQTMSQGYFILRIPAAQLRGVMDGLSGLGVVEVRNLQAQDVTQEYVDLSTRIRVLKETQGQLIALLKQARNVEEALKVRESLDAITMELERAIGRMRMLENQIGFSTLTLRLSQRGPQNAVPSSNDPFPWVDTLGVEATEWN